MFPSQQLQKLDISGAQSTCPLCQQSEGQQVYCMAGFAPAVVRSYTVVGDVMQESTFRYCSHCDFGYFYPLPDDTFFKKFYAVETNSHGKSLEALLASRPERQKRVSPSFPESQELSFIASHAIDMDGIRRGRAIDVGCGEGDFIGLANECGFHFEGVDPLKINCDFIEMCYKTKAFCCMLEDFPKSEHGKFSLVYSKHSLEHHPKPLDTLHKLDELLHEGGVLFISVPNLNSYAFQQMPFLHPYFAFPAHVNYFSTTSMRTTLSKLGFTDIDITTTVDAAQAIYCWDAAIKLGIMKMEVPFINDLRGKGQLENLFVFAVKGPGKRPQ